MIKPTPPSLLPLDSKPLVWANSIDAALNACQGDGHYAQVKLGVGVPTRGRLKEKVSSGVGVYHYPPRAD
jgi:hypothetical protein